MNSSKILSNVSKQLRTLPKISKRSCCGCHIRPDNDPILTILSATTKVGRSLALLMKQSPHLGELRLHDLNTNVSSVAEDLSHVDTRVRVKSFCGRSTMNLAILDADVVILVGGCRCSTNQTSKDLFNKNVDEVRLSALHMVEFNPKAVFCISRPPIEALVPLVSEEYKKAGVYDSRKIIGITSPASMRANYCIAAETGKNAGKIICPIVGGVSANCLIAVTSQAKPNLRLDSSSLSKIQQHLNVCEDDVLKLYADCGTICLAPSLAISRFLNILLRALRGDYNCVECAFVKQTGHIGQFLPYMTSIVRLGRQGVVSSHMPKVSGEEGQRLKLASHFIQNLISMGESFVTGELNKTPKCKPKPGSSKEKHQEVNENLSLKNEAKVVQ